MQNTEASTNTASLPLPARAELIPTMPAVPVVSGKPHPVVEPPRSRAREWWLCLSLAMVFAGWALRTIGAYTIVQADAARHFMNGVFFHDLLVSGTFTDVLSFARMYYSHYPALSVPYHPPLFPGVEALFFLIFGVNVLAARLAVAAAVAVSAILFFQIVKITHGSTAIAALSTITFFCLREASWLGSDTMLEFPSLAFTLAAVWWLLPLDRAFTVGRAIGFAFLGAAAVWTKQPTVFLGVLPVLLFAFTGRWREFFKLPVWVSTALFGVLVLALTRLSIPFHGAGVNQAMSPTTYSHHGNIIVHNFRYYFNNYSTVTGAGGLLIMGALLVSLILGCWRWRVSSLYIAWIVTAMGVLLTIRPLATRYLFHIYPAIIVLGVAGFVAVVQRFTGKPRWALAAAAVFPLTLLAWEFPYRTYYLHGPDEAARLLAASNPDRILYCGETDGQFILHYRIFQQELKTFIITGDKLPPPVFTVAGLEKFAHDYGIQYIVFEDSKAPDLGYPRAWMKMARTPSPSMVLEREIPLRSTTTRWNGTLRIFRFTNPSPAPKQVLSLRMNMIGGTMDFQLDR